MLQRRLGATLAVVLALMVQGATGAISRFEDTELKVNHFFGREVAMYAQDDAPFDRSKEGHVEIDVEIEKIKPGVLDTLDVVLLHSDVKEYIGKEVDGFNYMCCWQEQAEEGHCNSVGTMIIAAEAYEKPDSLYKWDFTWNNVSTEVKTLQQRVPIRKTGVWRLYMVNCGVHEKDEVGELQLNGKVKFLNPYGHLPGSIVGFMPLYLILTVLYMVVGGLWLALSIKHRQDLMLMQHCIAFVIAAGLLENLVFGLDYLVYNFTGDISLGFNLFSVIFMVVKRTASYVCLILITMGYTVTKPTLSNRTKLLVIGVGCGYFVTAGIYEFISMLRYTPATQSLNVSEAAEIFFLFLTLIFDFVILFWIFYNLFHTMGKLVDKRQSEKFVMFKKLAVVIAVAYLVSFIFFCIELGAVLGSLYDKWWRGWFIWAGYWSILHLVLVSIIGYIWRPNGNNNRYAYSTQLEDIEIEMPRRAPATEEEPSESKKDAEEKSSDDDSD